VKDEQHPRISAVFAYLRRFSAPGLPAFFRFPPTSATSRRTNGAHEAERGRPAGVLPRRPPADGTFKMAEDEEQPGKDAAPQELAWKEFLESTPPGVVVQIRNPQRIEPGGARVADIPVIELHCTADGCSGMRYFETEDSPGFIGVSKDFFLRYRCRNCGDLGKTYAVAAGLDASNAKALAVKYGEMPSFGPPLPSRIWSLIGPDRELFIRGRRCENQGLGIGAFAYYRRVVENQRARLIGEILGVAKRVNAPEQTLNALEAAAAETQFSKAVDDVKDAIPEVLKIDGHSPLTLLHAALSQGLHELTDSECLEYAASVRIVLTQLADRIAQALKDEAEIRGALSRLLNRKPRTA
jgi:hypothetical protein